MPLLLGILGIAALAAIALSNAQKTVAHTATGPGSFTPAQTKALVDALKMSIAFDVSRGAKPLPEGMGTTLAMAAQSNDPALIRQTGQVMQNAGYPFTANLILGRALVLEGTLSVSAMMTSIDNAIRQSQGLPPKV